MYEISEIQDIKEYIYSYPAEFRPKNICIFTDDDGNRVYLNTNYKKVVYNPKTKEENIIKLSEDEFFETLLYEFRDFYYGKI